MSDKAVLRHKTVIGSVPRAGRLAVRETHFTGKRRAATTLNSSTEKQQQQQQSREFVPLIGPRCRALLNIFLLWATPGAGPSTLLFLHFPACQLTWLMNEFPASGGSLRADT